jgi:hypothetical protein
MLFKASDRFRHGGLGNAQRLGGIRKAAVLYHGSKNGPGFKVGKTHKETIRFNAAYFRNDPDG